MNFAPATDKFDDDLWNYTDYVILNEVETEQLSKMEVKSVEDAEKACLALVEKIIQN